MKASPAAAGKGAVECRVKGLDDPYTGDLSADGLRVWPEIVAFGRRSKATRASATPAASPGAGVQEHEPANLANTQVAFYRHLRAQTPTFAHCIHEGAQGPRLEVAAGRCGHCLGRTDIELGRLSSVIAPGAVVACGVCADCLVRQARGDRGVAGLRRLSLRLCLRLDSEV